MAIIKCKMCGGDLRIEEGSTVCECEYCGIRQTVPSADNEKKLTLFSRAGRLLRGCEFDKAAGVFETIVADFPEEAEAYWGLVLCKYGIEYVDDPATGKKIPTCHRSSFDSVLDDPNYEQACENTDAVARRVYRDEARQIEDLRKRIIEVSGKEEPYDIFISYKETDENGDRTLDSVIAQDIYTELTEKGYRAFFSRISLEDKLGTEYEPYIFAALNSAKVMLVVGTDYENFDSVWVKNEWSRFLKLIASGQKKTLIPVFKNMDAYDMPKEFAKLAAQDMGKVGAMQDLVRGVEKLIGKKGEAVKETVKETVVVQQSGGPNVTALLKRGQQALEDGDWDKAKEYFDRVLDMDAENSDAFFGLFLAGTQCGNENGYIRRACTKEAQTEKLSIQPATERIRKAIKQYAVKDYLSEQDIQNLFQYDLSYSSALKAQQRISNTEKQAVEQDRNFSRATRYARNDEAAARRFKARLFAELDAAVKKAKEREAAAREKKQQNYEDFLTAAEKKAEAEANKAMERQEADRQKELAEREEAYQSALRLFEQAKSQTDYQSAKDSFLALVPYKDSAEMAKRCDEKMAQIKQAEAERQRIAKEKAEKAAQTKKKRRTIAAVLAVVLAVAGYLIYTKVIIPGKQYQTAEALFTFGQYEEAIATFTALGDYKDSRAKIEEVQEAILARDYAAAEALFEAEQYEQAIAAFTALGDYKDSSARIAEAQGAIRAKAYAAAEALLAEGDTIHASMAFGSAGNYKDARTRSLALWEQIAQRDAVAARSHHTVGLRSDGTVVAVGDNDEGQCKVSGWTDIVAVAAGGAHTVGLRSDGTVVAVGKNDNGQCSVSGWTDIVAVAAGDSYTVGLRSDGTVVAVGDNGNGQCEVSGWTDIVAVAAGDYHTVSLRSDGTVVATKYTGDQKYYHGQCEVSGWTDIVAVAAGGYNTVGLRSDGTVVAVGNNYDGQCEVSGWTDIVAVAAGWYHIVGLRSDGTVVAVGSNYYGKCEVSGWTDIVAVAAGWYHIVGLRSDGTVVATGNTGSYYNYGQCNVSGWTDIMVPETRSTGVKEKTNETQAINTDRAELLEACRTVGSTVTFGSYEQDNDTSNGKEPIEWIVLDVKDNRSLLISKYALDCQRYNTKDENVTWETCSLRKWLNETFLNSAFSAEQQAMIPTVTISADKNTSSSYINPGNSTEDQVFLLSYLEAKNYFSSSEARRCVPTAYTIAHGAYTNNVYKSDGKASCWWWLRSPGRISGSAANVYSDGLVGSSGNYWHGVNSGSGSVRPALWIDLEQ